MWCLLVAVFLIISLLAALWKFRWQFPSQRSPAYLKSRYGGWALITGASSGIGKQFAHVLASEGYDVILVARREQTLNQIAAELKEKYGVNTRVVVSDLSTLEGPARLFEEVKDMDIGLFINNAGVGWFGFVRDQKPEHMASIIQLNCTSMAVLTSLFVAKMRARTSPSGIITTSSSAAYCSIPCCAAYSSAKNFASNFTIATAYEEKVDPNSKVDIMVLEPGRVITEFGEASSVSDSIISETRTKVIETETVEYTVNTTLNHFAAGRAFCIPGAFNYSMISIVSLIPRDIHRIMLYKRFRGYVKE